MRVTVSVLFSFSVCAFSAAIALAEEPEHSSVVLKIPCDTAPWLACDALKAKLIDGVADPDFPGGMKALTRQMLDDVYLMKVRLAKGLTGGEECTTFDHLNKPPICPPLKIPENGCVDESITAFKVPNGVSANCPPISMVGAVTRDRPFFSLSKTDVGTRETSAIAGGLALAVSNQGLEISTEITKNALTISPKSPCYSRAVTLQSLIVAQSDVRLIEKINACDPNEQIRNCSAKEYFRGNLTAILSAYLQLARCRLSDESTKKFVAFSSDVGATQKSYTQILYDLFMQQCFYPNRGNPAAMRACYARKYDAWIKTRAKEMFPAVASACQ